MVARIERWGPISGLLFAVLMVTAFLIAGNSPNNDAPNQKIATYLAKTSSYHKNVSALFIALVGLLLLLAFFALLRARLVASGAFDGRAAWMYGAGVASTVFLFISITFFVSPLLAAHDARPAPIDPDFYRLTQDVGYLFWVASGMFGALAVLAAASAVLSGSAVFPRWFGWVGVVCGILALGTFFFIPVFAYWLWILIASVLLLVRAPAVTTGAAPATSDG